MIWITASIGLAGLTAALAYTIFRLATSESQEDPTTQRIQQLIDEANSLLKALDEQRHSA